jgi:xanthine dehydrogenase iron-sulfur cluster and FAD-binding subunit A
VKPVAFAYVRAETIEEACEVLYREGDGARILAGGQSLGAMLNMRIATPSVLVDINRIGGLNRIEQDAAGVRTGATVRQAAALRNPLIAGQTPLLAAALPHVGHYQTRSRGTLGGSVAHADPSAEIPLALAVLNGSVEIASRRKRRRVPARQFFVSALNTLRKPDEMIAALHWPAALSGDYSGFREYALRSGDYAIVAAACHVRLSEASIIEHLVIGFAGCGERPQILEHAAVGETLGPVTVAALAAQAKNTIECRADLHASAAYRRQLVGVLCQQLAADALKFFTERMEQAEARVHLADAEAAQGDLALSLPQPHPPADAALVSSKLAGAGLAGERTLAAPSRRRGQSGGEGGLRINSASSGQTLAAGQKCSIRFRLNGRDLAGEAEPRMHLADFLRHVLHAPGTHVGCEHGVCGACTVLIDGIPARACLTYAVQMDGTSVETVEGLAGNEALNGLQRTFSRHEALQCGFCTAGILMSATRFVEEFPEPNEKQVRDMLSGHICRCTGYQSIVDAILDHASERRLDQRTADSGSPSS